MGDWFSKFFRSRQRMQGSQDDSHDQDNVGQWSLESWSHIEMPLSSATIATSSSDPRPQAQEPAPVSIDFNLPHDSNPASLSTGIVTSRLGEDDVPRQTEPAAVDLPHAARLPLITDRDYPGINFMMLACSPWPCKISYK